MEGAISLSSESDCSSHGRERAGVVLRSTMTPIPGLPVNWADRDRAPRGAGAYVDMSKSYIR